MIIVYGAAIFLRVGRRLQPGKSVVGITELVVVLIVALIVIPPEKLPAVMQSVGKILRELRLASNTVVRELTEVTDPLSLRRPPPAIARPPTTSPPAAPTSPTSES